MGVADVSETAMFRGEHPGAASATKLNLGSGGDYREGQAWHNVDVRAAVGPDERVDLNEYPWPWPDDSWAHVLASHVVEHLDDQHRALQELARITAPGGTVRIRAPHWHSASMAIDPTHTQPLDPRTLTHDLAPDWTVVDVGYEGVRGAQLLPESVAAWLADMIGHFVIEWTADVRLPEVADED